MLQVDKIVNSIFESITWLLSDAERNQVWLVDCGDIEPILEKIKGKTVAGVLLTHAHFDHIYGLPELIKRFPSFKVFTNESGRETLANAKLNMSYYHETPLTFKGPQIELCGEGDKIALFEDVSASVYETPGHHPSCLTFIVGNNSFTGDAYIPGLKVVTNLPGADKGKARESMERIIAVTGERIVRPGHLI